MTLLGTVPLNPIHTFSFFLRVSWPLFRIQTFPKCSPGNAFSWLQGPPLPAGLSPFLPGPPFSLMAGPPFHICSEYCAVPVLRRAVLSTVCSGHVFHTQSFCHLPLLSLSPPAVNPGTDWGRHMVHAVRGDCEENPDPSLLSQNIASSWSA